MKTKTLSFLASIAMLSFASCTDEVQELANEPSQALKRIVMTTQDFDLETGSRTLYEIGEAVKCTWAANDTVGVFPEEGAQAYFPMASGAGTKNATFDGKGWALKDGKTYGAYYPCIGEFYLDRNAVPVSYSGQIQVGNASTAHLGAYDYMVASPAVSEFGSAQFTFKHLSALVQLRIAVPQPATLTSVKLVADTEAFAVKGEVDIMADAPGITSTKTAKEIVLNLQDVATKEENQVVTLYMMLPPTDLSEQTLKAVIESDKETQEIALKGRNFKAGTAYGLSGAWEEVVGNYEDGVVTLLKAGVMKQLLGDDCLNITSLKVVGPINGDDVRCLRQMLGGGGFYDPEKGKLATLDLSEASIVEGGEWYYEASPTGQFYTSNNAIGDYMFRRCANLQNITLPIGITSIGYRAFLYCDSLVSIDIPDGVSSIGNDAFSGCSSLTSVTMSDGVTSIGESAFSDCTSLTSINIPNSVTSISDYVFAGCTSLTSINIPDGVTSIGNGAFSYCSALKSINIPDGVTSIGNEVFLYCSSLTSVTIGDGVTSIGEFAFAFCTSLTSIDIPDGVTSIGESTFGDCSALASVTIGNGVTSINDRAFFQCSSLTSVIMGDGVTSIGVQAFTGCSSLTSIDISDSVTSIGENAFYQCYALVSIDIPDGVTSIDDGVFYGCSLTSIDIPDSVTSIGNEAFYGCSLTSIDIPDSVTSIGGAAFQDCSSLKSVTIGRGMTSIASYAFLYCSSLKDLYCYATTPPTFAAYRPFSSYGKGTTLHVPAQCGEKYKSSPWGTYFTTIKEME